MTVLGIVLGVAFFTFLVFIAKQATEMQDYLEEVKILQDHDLYE